MKYINCIQVFISNVRIWLIYAFTISIVMTCAFLGRFMWGECLYVRQHLTSLSSKSFSSCFHWFRSNKHQQQRPWQRQQQRHLMSHATISPHPHTTVCWWLMAKDEVVFWVNAKIRIKEYLVESFTKLLEEKRLVNQTQNFVIHFIVYCLHKAPRTHTHTRTQHVLIHG